MNASISIKDDKGNILVKGTADDLAKAAKGVTKATKRMKNTDADREVADRAYRVTADELRGFVERIERLDSERREIADQIAEVKAEAKARGYSVKAIAQVVRDRRRDASDLAEWRAVLELYRDVLEM